MIEDNQIEPTAVNDSKLSRYSSNNLKKSLDLAKKISYQNLLLGNDNYDSYDYNIYDSDSWLLSIGKSSIGERAFDFYSRLLNDRIILLGDKIDSDLANTIVAQLLSLEAESPDKDIYSIR